MPCLPSAKFPHIFWWLFLGFPWCYNEWTWDFHQILFKNNSLLPKFPIHLSPGLRISLVLTLTIFLNWPLCWKMRKQKCRDLRLPVQVHTQGNEKLPSLVVWIIACFPVLSPIMLCPLKVCIFNQIFTSTSSWQNHPFHGISVRLDFT